MGKHRNGSDRPPPIYEVGYKKPPSEHQFKPGNKAAKGRRKKRRASVPGMLLKYLSRPIKAQLGGKACTISRLEAAVMQLGNNFVTKPDRNLKIVLPLLKEAFGEISEAEGGTGPDHTANLRAKIEAMAERSKSNMVAHRARLRLEGKLDELRKYDAEILGDDPEA